MTDKPIGELEFLRKLQRLLDEGEFVATYKFALLNALVAQQSRHPSLAAARRDPRWPALVVDVAGIVRQMPLWKLQTVGGEVDEFLYRRADYARGAIRLLPGVPRAFRALYGLVVDAVRGAWMRQIARIAANRELLGDADLAAFLFGSERRNLAAYARLLRDHQRAACLYCGRTIGGGGDVDHFIAWSRYPADLGHNLVLAHRGCNAKKRDFLAHPRHVESWYRTHIERAEELASRCDEAGLPYDAERTRAVAWWAYEQGERAGAHAWIRADEFERLGGAWRDTLGGVRWQRVAEPEPPGYVG